MIVNPLGGKSGLTPVIRVTSVSGSELTCGTQEYTLGASETTHDFKVKLTSPATTYTVTAEKDNITKQTSVQVDEVALYTVDMTSLLPTGFQEVEYIQNDGTAYIDTGLYCSNYINFEAKLRLVTASATDVYECNLFGISSGSTESSGRWGFNVRLVSSYREYWFFTLDTSTPVSDTIPYSELFNDFTISEDSNRALVINDTSIATVALAPNLNYNIYLFRGNYKNSAVRGANTSRMYYFKLNDGTTAKRDFVPCYCTEEKTAYQGTTQTTAASGTIGLYDTINNRFYINSASSGSFTKGDDV